MTDCIFCKIVNGKVPSKKIYEDEESFAFLDINPFTEGHTLLIPKEHYEDIFDVPEKELKNLIGVSRKISETLKTKLKCDGINILNSNGKAAQQEINHFHIHIIPRYLKSKFKLNAENVLKEKSLDKSFKKIREI